MIRVLAIVLLLLLSRQATAASALTGLWLPESHDGIIAVSRCGGDLCARIAGVVLDHPNDKMPVDYRGTSQCQLALITDARQTRPNLWEGHITDPRNGDVFGVELHLDPQGALALRGFFGIPLIGHTQTWTRYPGSVPANCRLIAGVAQRQGNR